MILVNTLMLMLSFFVVYIYNMQRYAQRMKPCDSDTLMRLFNPSPIHSLASRQVVLCAFVALKQYAVLLVAEELGFSWESVFFVADHSAGVFLVQEFRCLEVLVQNVEALVQCSEALVRYCEALVQYSEALVQYSEAPVHFEALVLSFYRVVFLCRDDSVSVAFP